MRSAASVESTRRYFARRNAPAAAASLPSRESAYRGALALWDRAHPEATYVERDAEARRLRRLRRVHRV